ncbi:unnamed protein product [Cuscuta campestris]|uniref:Uncharacterized protein n=1 Tax=Cuscuta campestris TaxID=132261 RepID=A0A484L942_9ASTE|nr:unnamed protein product [Cuscuta campestris]
MQFSCGFDDRGNITIAMSRWSTRNIEVIDPGHLSDGGGFPGPLISYHELEASLGKRIFARDLYFFDGFKYMVVFPQVLEGDRPTKNHMSSVFRVFKKLWRDAGEFIVGNKVLGVGLLGVLCLGVVKSEILGSVWLVGLITGSI